MRKLTFANIIFLALLSLFQGGYVSAWDNEVTHRGLSEYAAGLSILSTSEDDYLKNLGFNLGLDEVFGWGGKNQTVTKWLREGAFLEDAGSKLDAILGKARFTNHFHNPLPIKTWATAGLSDLGQSGESALIWAQDSAKQSVSLGKDWSWQAVRDSFYSALTKTGDAGRQEYFARTFQGLGYQMHLIQDMSQPDHVRNDAHPMDGAGWVEGLETWAKKNPGKIKTFATTTTSLVFPQVALNTNIDGYMPISQFIDTNQYDGTNPGTSLSWGLSEYTNSNYLSDNTIFTENTATTDKHYFPYPRYSGESYETYLVDYSSTKKRIYIRKKGDGETLEHFATTGPLRKYLSFDPELQRKALKLDSAVHQDYSEKLIPRAVGYSAGLLNYFFRGSIDIALPNSGIYSSATPTNSGFTTIKVFAKNTTANGEEMLDGSIELVVKYRLALEDPFKNYAEDYDFQVEPDFSYIVAPEKNGVRTISRTGPVELTFDLPAEIPLWAIDVYLQVVYHGKLGNEDGAVAVGFKDISEPTPIDISSDTDRICINGNFYTAGSPTAISLVDKNDDGIALWDVYQHSQKDVYIKMSSQAAPKNASPTDYSFYIPVLPAGDFSRQFYILTDKHFNYSIVETWVNDYDGDPWIYLPSQARLFAGTAITNQTDYVEDAAECSPWSAPCYIWWYPEFLSYRSRDEWWGSELIYINWAYPQGAECSCYSGIVNTCNQ